MFLRNRKYKEIECEKYPEYICYLSYSKVDNLYSQISNMDIKEINSKHIVDIQSDGSLESDAIFKIINGKMSLGGRNSREYQSIGYINYIQKFRKIIDYCYKNNKIVELEKFISKEVTGNFLLYTITEVFSCEYFGMDQDIIKKEKQEADSYNIKGEKYKKVGDIAILHATTKLNIQIELACSMKYFSDMGESRVVVEKGLSENDYFDIHPHSGNYSFFEGEISGTFEAIILLLGKKDNVLYGSPLALINKFSPIEI